MSACMHVRVPISVRANTCANMRVKNSKILVLLENDAYAFAILCAHVHECDEDSLWYESHLC